MGGKRTRAAVRWTRQFRMDQLYLMRHRGLEPFLAAGDPAACSHPISGHRSSRACGIHQGPRSRQPTAIRTRQMRDPVAGTTRNRTHLGFACLSLTTTLGFRTRMTCFGWSGKSLIQSTTCSSLRTDRPPKPAAINCHIAAPRRPALCRQLVLGIVLPGGTYLRTQRTSGHEHYLGNRRCSRR